MTRDQIMVVEAAIDAMAGAADRYRTGRYGASTDAPGWVLELDENKLALTRMVAAAQDEILKRAPKEPIPCAD